MPKILIADALSDEATAILSRSGMLVDVKTGRSQDEILADIAEYDGLIVRSATKVTRTMLEAASRLKVVGRAGVGVDNIDLAAATERGVVVMNTPLGNIVSAAEHTLALLFALARHVPIADRELHDGEWNRKAHTGVELEGKTLGIVGLGKIGQHVARVARATGMQLVGYDPFINPKRAQEIGVELMEMDELLVASDFITLHVPKTDQTADLIDREAIGRMKPGSRLINVSRGGVVNEQDLADALTDGRLAGAALDVFAQEPLPADNPLLQAPNLILTPHLGASTEEAQSKVAEQIAEQFVAFLQDGRIQNAVNLNIHLEPELAAYGELATTLGSLAIQLIDARAVSAVHVHCRGKIAEANTRALAVCALSGVLRETCSTPVNLVNAATIAESRGIELVEERSRRSGSFTNLLEVEIRTATGRRKVGGTCFDEAKPRIVEIDDLDVDLKPADTILVMRYDDRPGMVGKFGTILGDAGVNIANMDVGRVSKGKDAIVCLTVDDPVPAELQEKLRQQVQPKELHVVSL